MDPKSLDSAFKTEVHDKAAYIDPNNDLDWYSLTVGFALAKGATPEEAIEIAVHIRYETDLG